MPLSHRGRGNGVVVFTTKDKCRFRKDRRRRDDDVSPQHRSSSSISLSTIVPMRYPPHITNSRSSTQFGVENFDIGCRSFVGPSPLGLTPSFRFYNKIAYGGLETHIISSESWPGRMSRPTVCGSTVYCANSGLSCSRTHTEPIVNQGTSARRSAFSLNARYLPSLSYISRVKTCGETSLKPTRTDRLRS